MESTKLATKIKIDDGQVPSLLDWNYVADLDRLKQQLASSELEDKSRVSARFLIRSCLGLTLTHNKNQPSPGNWPHELDTSSHTEEVRPVILNTDVMFRINPLDIPMIFDNVLSYLPLNALLKSRLVNRSWNSTSIPSIRTKRTKRVDVKSKDFPRFCENFEKSTLLPFTKLGIVIDEITLFHCLQFFTKHGAALEDLKITENEFSEGWKRREHYMKLRHIFRQVPNLKKLNLDFYSFPNVEDTTESIFDGLPDISLSKVEKLVLKSGNTFTAKFLNGVFSILPNVKVLQLADFDGPDQDWEIFSSVLKNVTLHTVFRPESWDHFELLDVIKDTQRLKELSIFLEINDAEFSLTVEAQTQLLKSQSESLEILSLVGQAHLGYEDNNPPLVSFPVMKKLQTIICCLEPAIKEEDSVIFPMDEDVPFCMVPVTPDQVPSLQSLLLDHRILKTAFQESSFRRVQAVDLGGWRQANCHVLPALISRFPCLRKLTNLCLTFQENEMALIVSNLQNVEELQLDIWDDSAHSKMSDFNLVISGVPVGSKWIVAELEGHLGKESAPAWIDPPGPSLRDLKCLTKLGLSFDFQGKEECYARIDEIGVYLTFLRMSPKLKLRLDGNFSITDDLAAKMTNHFQNVYFNVKAEVTAPKFFDREDK